MLCVLQWPSLGIGNWSEHNQTPSGGLSLHTVWDNMCALFSNLIILVQLQPRVPIVLQVWLCSIAGLDWNFTSPQRTLRWNYFTVHFVLFPNKTNYQVHKKVNSLFLVHKHLNYCPYSCLWTCSTWQLLLISFWRDLLFVCFAFILWRWMMSLAKENERTLTYMLTMLCKMSLLTWISDGNSTADRSKW